jgi:hypothetical protein
MIQVQQFTVSFFDRLLYVWMNGIITRHLLWVDGIDATNGFWQLMRMKHICKLGYVSIEVRDKVNVIVRNSFFVLNGSKKKVKSKRNKLQELYKSYQSLDVDTMIENFSARTTGAVGVH